jgi:hypothetical protein
MSLQPRMPKPFRKETRSQIDVNKAAVGLESEDTATVTDSIYSRGKECRDL